MKNMPINNDEISAMTGERRRAPEMKLDQIAINGNSGVFKVLEFTKPKNTANDKIEVQEFDKGIDVVFLKIRRKLVASKMVEGKVEVQFQTNEHNNKNDLVEVWGKKSDEGTAEQMRDKYPDLKTQQIVYVRFGGKIMRLVVKGLSLKSLESDTQELSRPLGFYDYISTFKNNEHFWQFKTKLSAEARVAESGSTFQAIVFERGVALTEEQINEVVENIKTVHAFTTKVDEYYGNTQKKTTLPVAKVAPKIGTTDVEYPTDDVDAEDIPF